MNSVMAIARTTVGEAIRRKVLLVILLISILVLVIAPSMNMLTARQSQTVLLSLIFGVQQISSAVIAIVLTVYMIPNEIERRTIYTILSKPVLRWQFLLGKYLGAIAALGLMIALMSGIMILVFALFQADTPRETFVQMGQQSVTIFVQMCLLAAVSVFFSTFVNPIVNFFISGGVYLIGTVMSPIFSAIQKNDQLPPAVKMAAQLITTVIPNFAQYNTQNALINSGQEIVSGGAYMMQITGYGVVYITILLLAGMLVFDKREV